MPRCPSKSKGRGAGCWGGQIQWQCVTECALGNANGSVGFAHKFCDDCRERVVVSASRVRALTDELKPLFCNRRSYGIWNSDTVDMTQGRYRVINNTRGCTPPALVLFEGRAPFSLEWTDVPSEWLSDQDAVVFTVSRGTLVPLVNPDTRHLPEKEAPTLSDVLVPSVTMRLAMPLVEELSEEEVEDDEDEDDEDEEAPPAPEVACDNHPNLAPLEELSLLEELKPLEQLSTAYQEDRKYHRMMRNRAAAASSRERKSRYIRKLETQVDELTRVVHKLREENCLLYFLDLKPEECAVF